MPEHYYSKRPQTKKVTNKINATLRGRSLSFQTSSGVFSKRGVDFGSELLIEQFVCPEVEGDILDLGCGYGPIGISLASFYPDRNVTLVDVNERAVQLAEENKQTNETSNVEVLASDGFGRLTNRQFAAIVTNPPIRAGKKIIYHLFAESKTHLVNDGELWLVIQKKQGAPSAIRFLSEYYSTVDTMDRKKGYYIIRAKK